MMWKSACAVLAVGLLLLVAGTIRSENPAMSAKGKDSVSFKADIFPVIKSRCLPCHAEDNYNPSELSMDSYSDLMGGGKHGKSIVPGKSKESPLVQKLKENPPFGDRMPLNRKKTIEEGKAKWLSPEEIQRITQWIDEGAKDN